MEDHDKRYHMINETAVQQQPEDLGPVGKPNILKR